ncbi:hypothetical protein QR98_0056920 [Sarcoptes scabiei]|uniref:Uncharacterized protein n=1 Tax=Sarcoptes scabiei TaxID=52283 RepID=A0A132A9C8_SARSC|nr:hypothetical protein QR98_0056920 [Sarcoptes scabiei]
MLGFVVTVSASDLYLVVGNSDGESVSVIVVVVAIGISGTATVVEYGTYVVELAFKVVLISNLIVVANIEGEIEVD